MTTIEDPFALEPVEPEGETQAPAGEGLVNVPCTCGCKCLNIVTVSTFSPVFAAHARCERCSQPEHLHEYGGVTPLAIDVPTSPFITPRYQETPEERALADAAVRDYREQLFQEAWDRWQQSIPAKFRYATPAHEATMKALERISSGKLAYSSLLLEGHVGTGKTWNAVGYANQAIRDRHIHPAEVLFGTEVTLLSSVANASFGQMEEALRRLTIGKYKLIVIDDVGRGNWARESMRQPLFSHVINEQYARNHAIVITTNLSRAELRDYIGTAAYDRLMAMTAITNVGTFDKTNRRMRQETTRSDLT